jgi:hypothetical protein
MFLSGERDCYGYTAGAYVRTYVPAFRLDVELHQLLTRPLLTMTVSVAIFDRFSFERAADYDAGSPIVLGNSSGTDISALLAVT